MPRSCPDCEASLEDAFVVRSHLSDLGYLHDDRTLECPECPWRGTFGHPIDPETTDPPACAVCGGRTYPYKLDFHRVTEKAYTTPDGHHAVGHRSWTDLVRDIDVHWKCEDCHYFQNRDLEHYTADVYGMGVEHLVGDRS